MKKTIIFSTAVALGLSLASCDDFLTEDVRGSENLDTYFKTDEAVGYAGVVLVEVVVGKTGIFGSAAFAGPCLGPYLRRPQQRRPAHRCRQGLHRQPLPRPHTRS